MLHRIAESGRGSAKLQLAPAPRPLELAPFQLQWHLSLGRLHNIGRPQCASSQSRRSTLPLSHSYPGRRWCATAQAKRDVEKRCGHIRSLPPFFIASLSFLPGNQQHGGERCEQQASRAAPVVHISPMSTIDLLALFGAELPLVLALRMCRMCHSGQTSVSWCSAILTS